MLIYHLLRPSHSNCSVTCLPGGFLSWLHLYFLLFHSSVLLSFLRAFDGRAADDIHLPRYLTLNGLIAAIATLNKTCLTIPVYSAMMQETWLYFASEARKIPCRSRLHGMELYTNASTGTLGSLVFVTCARGTRLVISIDFQNFKVSSGTLISNSRLVARLGCLITIFTLANSTFAQQLIGLATLPSRSIASLGNLVRTETWETGDDSNSAVPMLNAIYTGILTPAVQPVVAACPTGNCTWPLTPSLAICSSCKPSTYVKLGCSNFTTCFTDMAIFGNPGGSSTCFRTNYCNYSLPSGDYTSLRDFQVPYNASGNYDSNPVFQAISVRTCTELHKHKTRWPIIPSQHQSFWRSIKLFNIDLLDTTSSVERRVRALGLRPDIQNDRRV